MATLYLKDKNGKRIRVALRDGSHVQIKVREKPYRYDIRTDRTLCTAVQRATAAHLSNGNPVARYDLKQRKPYWEYPDGSIRYAE